MYFQVSMIVLALTSNNDMMELIIYAKYSWESTDQNSHSTMNATKPKTQNTKNSWNTSFLQNIKVYVPTTPQSHHS